jgi:hypothetical protein
VNQLFHGVWITVEVLLESVDGARILVAPEDQFLFTVAPGFLRNAGQYQQQADGQHGNGDHHDDQPVTERAMVPHRAWVETSIPEEAAIPDKEAALSGDSSHLPLPPWNP